MPLRKTIVYFLTVLFTTTALAGFCSQAEASHTGATTGRSTVAENGVVAAAHPLAAQAGLDVLKKVAMLLTPPLRRHSRSESLSRTLPVSGEAGLHFYMWLKRTRVMSLIFVRSRP